MSGFVEGRGVVMDTADDGVFVGELRHARKDFRDADAGNIGTDGLEGAANGGGRVRLHVPGVELGGSANERQHDAADVRVADRGWGFQSEAGENSGVKKVAA